MGAMINKNFNSMKKILFLAAFCLTVGLAMAQKPVKSNTQQPAQTATTQQQCSGNHSACPHQQAQAQPKGDKTANQQAPKK